MQTFRDLRVHADDRLLAGDYPAALFAYAALVRLDPADLDARLRIGDTLLAMGEVQRAAQVYTALARHAAHAGYPLRALVALKVLQALEPQLGSLLGSVAELYAVGSSRLGRGARPALPELDRPLPEGVTLQPPEDAATLVEQATQQGTAVERTGVPYPDKLPAIPVFSQLPAEAFAAVLGALKLVRSRPGDVLIEQGAEGTSFFVLVRGTVRVTKHLDGADVVLAGLHDGAIFGEMALVSAQPRTATVTAVNDCDLLEFDRAALQAASREVATIARGLDQFMRERMLNNLLATAPLFRPLDRKQRLDLARRFNALDVAAGTELIREGDVGRGLYVLLHGEVDVSKRDGDEKVLLATLGPGDVFGEIALLQDEPATATVTAAVNGTVLFLDREIFRRLVEAVPEVREYVENLGEERLMDTQLLMAPAEDDVEETVELSDDDLLMI
ncbi:MAG: cyclic nucleotide-binding domain-containing protein [Myxococcota bacterium]